MAFIFGDTGVGKTTAVKQKYPANIRYNTIRGKDPFFGYDGQEVLFFDEFNPKNFEIEYLNELLDRSPIEIHVRYGKRTACYTKVIFASNTTFENIYAELRNGNEDDRRKYMALMRRIQNVYNFNNPEHRQKFLDDIPTGNPFYNQKSQKNVNYEIRLFPEECKDLPW